MGHPSKRKESPFRRVLRGPVIYLLVVLAGLWVFLLVATRGPHARDLSLPQFEQQLAAGHIRAATFLEHDQRIVGQLQDGTTYETTYPYLYQQNLTGDILRAPNPVNLKTNAQKGSVLFGALISVILRVVLVAGLPLLLIRQLQARASRAMSFGQPTPRAVSTDRPKATCTD